jgi:hypothetical protein
MSELLLFDPLRGRPADLPVIREELLERIEWLRASAAEPSVIQEAIDDYEFYTALGRRPS